MLVRRIDEGHSFSIFSCALFRSETTGDLLFYLTETDGTFCLVVREGNRPITGKAQNFVLVVFKALQERPYLALSGT